MKLGKVTDRRVRRGFKGFIDDLMVGEAVQEQLREFLCVPTYTDGRPMPNTRSNVTEIIQERHVDSWRIE